MVYISLTSVCSLCSSLNHEAFSDICWTIAMYVECLAMLPQLYMFQKQAGADGSTVEVGIWHNSVMPWASHHSLSIAVFRLCWATWCSRWDSPASLSCYSG